MEEFQNRYRTKKKFGKHRDLFWEFDPDVIELFNKIIEKTNAKIVISSTWRQIGIDSLRECLKKFGIKGEIIDVTPNLLYIKNLKSSVPRGLEINEWLEINEPEYYSKYNYVIIDDSCDMLYIQRNNFVQTNYDYGLTTDDVNKAIEILNK